MAFQTITWTLEMEFSGEGSGWTDVTGDVLLGQSPIVTTEGFSSISLVECLASPGDISFVLDNSPANSGGKYGYYSPGHANCRSGFAKNIRVRYSETFGGTTYYQGIYWLKTPIPTAGLWNEAVTRCRATDWLELSMNIPLPAVAVQTSKRGDQLITTLLAAVTTQPCSTDLDTGDSTFARAFDTDDVDRDSVYSVLGKIARSEYGRVYLLPSTTCGGTLKFEHRNARLGNVTSLGTISDTMDDAFVIDDAGQVADRFQVSITPRRVDTSLVTVAALDYKMSLGPGETRTFDIPYVEQVGGARISASNIQTPVANTDFKFGSTEGTSSDLNANLTITMPAVPGANSCHITVQNTGTSTGYLNLFQLRGYGIYPYNSYTVEVGSGGLRVGKLDMPYQDNPNTADAVANYLQSIASDNTRRGVRIRVTANKSAAAMAFALTGNISTRWTVAETLTGLSGDHFVNGRKRTMSLGNLLTVEALMVPAGSSTTWVLGTSALGTDTKLAV